MDGEDGVGAVMSRLDNFEIANSLRDGVLVSLSIKRPGYDKDETIELVCEKELNGRVSVVTVTFAGIKEYRFRGGGGSPWVAFVKCLWTPEGDLYISLDPYDEREPPTESDGDVIRATTVRMTIEERPAQAGHT
jgi:hypothetical protein